MAAVVLIFAIYSLHLFGYADCEIYGSTIQYTSPTCNSSSIASVFLLQILCLAADCAPSSSYANYYEKSVCPTVGPLVISFIIRMIRILCRCNEPYLPSHYRLIFNPYSVMYLMLDLFVISAQIVQTPPTHWTLVCFKLLMGSASKMEGCQVLLLITTVLQQRTVIQPIV
jgi:hypothetical protein